MKTICLLHTKCFRPFRVAPRASGGFSVHRHNTVTREMERAGIFKSKAASDARAAGLNQVLTELLTQRKAEAEKAEGLV